MKLPKDKHLAMSGVGAAVMGQCGGRSLLSTRAEPAAAGEPRVPPELLWRVSGL